MAGYKLFQNRLVKAVDYAKTIPLPTRYQKEKIKNYLCKGLTIEQSKVVMQAYRCQLKNS
jgi:hypothetical protein